MATSGDWKTWYTSDDNGQWVTLERYYGRYNPNNTYQSNNQAGRNQLSLRETFVRGFGEYLKNKNYQRNNQAGRNQQSMKQPQYSTSASSVLGEDIHTGQLVTLEQEQRLKGLYVIGKTGSGKTTLLVNMILQDIEQGMGVCFFDTHGDAITDILRRLPPAREDDVILLDLLDNDYAFGLNLFQCKNPKDMQEVSRVTSFIMQIFAKLFTEHGDLMKEAPNMARTLQNTIPVLLAHQQPRMTMAEMPLLYDDKTARAKLLAPLRNAVVRSFWDSYSQWSRKEQEDLTFSTNNRVNNFLHDSLILDIIGQSEAKLDFRKIMDEKKILLVKLSRQHELITSLVGSVIVAQIANAAFSRSDTPEDQRVQFNLYADEYQRFSTPTFAELLAEVRKFKIATCVAHQWRGQLDHANRGATLNAANMVVFQVSGEDAQELAGQFKITPQEAWEEVLEEEWVEVLEEEWEEEIEKESVEVLEEEWTEKIEDEVIDGEEAIRTPVQDVVNHLISRGDHPNPVVNKFALNLQRLHGYERHEQYRLSTLNIPLYKAMSEKNPFVPIPTEVLTPASHWGGSLWYLELTFSNYGFDETKRGYQAFSRLLSSHNLRRDFQVESAILEQEIITLLAGETEQRIIKRDFDYYLADIFPVKIADRLKQIQEIPEEQEKLAFVRRELKLSLEYALTSSCKSVHVRVRRMSDPLSYDLGYDAFWEHISISDWFNEYTKRWVRIPEKVQLQRKDDFSGLEPGFRLVPGQEKSWYTQKELDDEVERLIKESDYQQYLPSLMIPAKVEEARQRARKELRDFEAFLLELREVMQVLATPEGRIEADSGLVQPRTRKQIHYITHPRQTIMHPRKTISHPRQTITHPRKAIMHPQRTYADMQHEIANNLASPVKAFTARAKIGTREYTIQALQFRQPQPDWITRRDRIVARTRDLYCKARMDVEEEIQVRKEALTKREQKKAQTTLNEDEE